MSMLYNRVERLLMYGYWGIFRRGNLSKNKPLNFRNKESEMQIDNYLEYSEDEVISIESMESTDNRIINKVITKYGNTLYWDSDTGRIIQAFWVVPNVNRIDCMDEADLDKISGEFYLRSYGEKFNR